GHHFPARFIRL
ncbi:hypothetical protein D043_3873B, partial [Vibrio parahaemolyticus EKP-021]